MHQGVDYGAPTGTPILAAARGRVDLAGELSGYGSAVVLRHNNDTLETLYGHMSQILVKEGQWVEQGTVIGLVGSTGYSTGPHLHFEVLKPTPDGWVAIDPIPQINQSVAQQNTTIVQPTASLNQPTPSIQASIPGNPLTVTTLQPTNVGNPATPMPQVVSMSIGLNGVVKNPDPIANLKALGNQLVSFEAKQSSSQLLNPVGVLAPLAFSPPITPKLSSLIAPQLSQPAAQGPVPASVATLATPQIVSQEWVSFPPPASLMPDASQEMTNALIPGTTPSSQVLSSTQTQATSNRQTAMSPPQKTIAARTTATLKPGQKQPAKRPLTQAQRQAMLGIKVESPSKPSL
jgi:pyruvate/2-oxoglutarate dehydrogenase complex dihydrolipoamide acyltransferase (E2) component